MNLLAKSPDDRNRSVGELVKYLERISRNNEALP
jgi:hypothetical protein